MVQHPTPQPAIPPFEPERTLWPPPIWIDAAPNLQWGAPAKMLMRAHRVVPETELRQRQVQVSVVGDGVGAQRRLERAEQALDATVLSRAGEFGEAQPHARNAHEALESPCMVNGMVVELDRQWHAMLAGRQVIISLSLTVRKLWTVRCIICHEILLEGLGAFEQIS